MKYLIALTVFVILSGLWFFFGPTTMFPSSIRTDHAEGSCSLFKNTCRWAGDGCGGGHGVCTDTPEKYDGMGSFCDINLTFPSNQGYKCTCLFTQGTCGWAK